MKQMRATVVNATQVARASVARMIVTGVARVVGALVGLGFAGLGYLFISKELSGAPPYHTAHIYIGVTLVLFGGLCVAPSVVGASIKFVIVTVGPMIPMIGGRRAGDPPASRTLPGRDLVDQSGGTVVRRRVRADDVPRDPAEGER